MPQDFPDADEFPLAGSLIEAGQCHEFRPPNKLETQDEYRVALADHVMSRDFVESEEIRNKVGWDKFTMEQNRDMLKRRGLSNLF